MLPTNLWDTEGSPISPFFADLVLEDLEVFCWNRLKIDFNIITIFYYRCDDDLICCIKKEDIHIVNKVFNEFDCNLKFTYEIENNNKINFLDVSLVKENGNIITDWYYKPMSSNRTLNYLVNHPLSLKKNIVFNLIDRVILSSDKRFHKEIYHESQKYLLRIHIHLILSKNTQKPDFSKSSIQIIPITNQ